MTLNIEIPDSVARALRLPEKEQRQQIITELAVALYAQGILSFGKACELAGMRKIEFGLALNQRGIPRQYTEQDLQDDLAYANSQ
jgi:predicted HTH domain antitoxin